MLAETGFVLRRAGPRDAEAVAALTRAAYAKWVPLIGREPRPMTADHGRAVREHVVDMLLDGPVPVALVEMIERADDILIENLAVRPAYEGRGLGTALLDYAAAHAIARGRTILRLYTNALFASNLAFYARRGFAVEREDAVAGGRIVHMARALPAGPTP